MSKAFGTLRPILYQSDYISMKNAGLMTSNRNSLQSNVYKSKYLNDIKNRKYLIDKSHLAYGLYKKKDLTNICSVIEGPPCINYSCPQCLDPVPIKVMTDDNKPFYHTNSSTIFCYPKGYQKRS